MAYKQGSMGMAILAALGIFIVVDMILGFAFYSPAGGYALIMGPLTYPLNGFGLLFNSIIAGFTMVDTTGLLIGIMIPVICGILAGVIARGSAGRGFIAGFSGVAIGYFIMFLLMFVVMYSLAGGFMMTALSAQIIPLLIYLIVVPILLGIFGGIGGALMSAILASPADESAQMQSSTTFIQASAPPAPMVFQGGYPQQPAYQQPPPAYPQNAPQAAAKVLCPACKTQNDGSSTFCQSCGTRLKS